MFNSVREKIYSAVQDGIDINSGVFKKSQNTKAKKRVDDRCTEPNPVNYDAGGELLYKYQEQWKEMHEEAEKNALLADNIDAFMTRINLDINDQLNNITTINSTLAAFPQLLASMDQCMSNIKELRNTAKTVEDDLVRLEDLIEKCDFKHRQAEHTFQLTMYTEKKFAEFEQNRISMAKQKAEAAKTFELRQRSALLEKQRVAQEAFQKDIDMYKSRGIVPTTSNSKPAKDSPSSLEDVHLENENTSELDEFLNE